MVNLVEMFLGSNNNRQLLQMRNTVTPLMNNYYK
jgi:hypothetical protein